MSKEQPIRVGVSACLLGERVRWDGNHKREAYVAVTLARIFDLVPVCPEVAIGLGVPRPPIGLVETAQGRRAIGVTEAGLDATEHLAKYGRKMAGELADLSGYILKSDSPSCGMERVKVYRANGGPPLKAGTGIYTEAFRAARPELPMEEEGRLNDPTLRENFVERVFAYRRWQELKQEGLTRGQLVSFHTAHKLSLMAHGVEPYRTLGRLVASAGKRRVGDLAEEYILGFMAALKLKATRKLHTNVLTHLAGYLKRSLDAADRAELVETIESYRLGHVPLVVPITLLKHHFRRNPHPYVAGQVYLDPHPAELMLRNSL